MILPTKHLPTSHSLLGLGALVLVHLDRPRTVTGLWDRVRSREEFATYSRLVLALDLLFAIGAINFDQGMLRRAK